MQLGPGYKIICLPGTNVVPAYATNFVQNFVEVSPDLFFPNSNLSAAVRNRCQINIDPIPMMEHYQNVTPMFDTEAALLQFQHMVEA
jgi:hypothetical protein